MFFQSSFFAFLRYYGYYGYGYGYYTLMNLIYLLPAILLALAAQAMVKSNYKKYSQIVNIRGVTGEAAARAVLSAHGITDVRIEHTSGFLSDHYSPTEKIIRLSDGVFGKASIAAVGIAAHEAGHAVQHAEGYVPNKIRSSVIPVANIGSRFAVPLILIGAFLPAEFSSTVTWLGIIAYSLAVLVYLVTLPVEFNASRRALATIKETNLLQSDEYSGAKKVLTAAAMTYVASAISALVQFLRLLLIARGRSRR